MMETLRPLIADLGFSSPQQQRAFMRLLQATGCLGELPQAPAVITQNQADALLDNITFPARSIAADWLHTATQNAWIHRQPGCERHEITTRPELQPKEAQIQDLINTLDMHNEIIPQRQHFEHALVLGATEMNMMVKRYREIAANWPEELKNIPLIAVDTVRKDGQRANTRDTIEAWLVHKPAPGAVLAISSQPYVAYQDAAIRSTLSDAFSLETVGPAHYPPNLPAGLALDTLARQIDCSKERLRIKRESLPDSINQVTLVHVSDVRHDADRFQYRTHSDASGIRPGEQIEGEYNPLLHGGMLLLYEQEDQKLFVVDGHHRVELAQRSGQDIMLPARILRQKDGITPTDAMVIGAYVNMAKEFRDPAKTHSEGALAEAANVFHAVHGGAVQKELLPAIDLHKDKDLATAYTAGALSDPAFSYVQAGAVPVAMGAEVAKVATSGKEQTEIMQLISRELMKSNWRERMNARAETARTR